MEEFNNVNHDWMVGHGKYGLIANFHIINIPQYSLMRRQRDRACMHASMAQSIKCQFRIS